MGITCPGLEGAAGRPASAASHRSQVRAQELQDPGWRLPATRPDPQCPMPKAPAAVPVGSACPVGGQLEVPAPAACAKGSPFQGPSVMFTQGHGLVWQLDVVIPHEAGPLHVGAQLLGQCPFFFCFGRWLWIVPQSVTSRTRMTRRMLLSGASCVGARHSDRLSPPTPPSTPCPHPPFEDSPVG